VSRFVLDCSIAMAWHFESIVDAYADSVLESLADSEAIVPSIWPLQVVNALLVSERRKLATSADSVRCLAMLLGLPIEVDLAGYPLEMLTGLGRDHGLSSYDAAYLHLAMREGLPLATRDKPLAAAAKAAGVERFRPHRD
jgi:predicted nucleic acid-binding protein